MPTNRRETRSSRGYKSLPAFHLRLFCEPAPGGADDFVQRANRRPPTKHLACERSAADKCPGIARSTANEAVLNVPSGDAPATFDHFQHRKSLAIAKVIGLGT